MSRESLLDEAIAKAKEAEDWQLVEWLRMARSGESASRWYTEKLQEAQAENAKLRELVAELYEDQCTDGDQWRYRDRMRELGVEVDG